MGLLVAVLLPQHAILGKAFDRDHGAASATGAGRWRPLLQAPGSPAVEGVKLWI
jgi:hypothetical protein